VLERTLDKDHPRDFQWIGFGVYTIAEAARLTGISVGRIRRWVKGYSFRSHGEKRVSPPVVLGHFAAAQDTQIAISFADLIEVRCVHAFLEAGVHWKTLRAAHARAVDILGLEHPFATQKFFTDGHTILTRIDEQSILDIVGNQLGFKRILERYLKGALEFVDQVPIRWWPMGRRRAVVIDATRSFGQPIIDTEGVPTAVLYRAYQAERSEEDRLAGAVGEESGLNFAVDPVAIGQVSNWFGVEKRSVRTAIEYELQLAA
jgi:hypothetical protein